MDKIFHDLESDFKTYSNLTVNQGQIHLNPGTKNCIKAFIQWSRDKIRMGLDPANEPFPVNSTAMLIHRYKTHIKIVSDSKTVTEAAKPKDFTSNTKRTKWMPSFRNYLSTIPGRDGAPLAYVIRDEVNLIPSDADNILDKYVSLASLNAEAYPADTCTVRTLLVNMISGNETTEAKIQNLAQYNDGLRDFIALKEHYEGVGVHSKDITKAVDIIDNLYYSGEKPPHMWWDEFEKELEWAFTTFDLKEGCIVHSNEMKLRVVLEKNQGRFPGCN